MASAAVDAQFCFPDVGSSPTSAESSFREMDDAFLQTQTRIWLGEVLQTRFDEHTNICDLLADGRILFEVSKVISRMLLTTCMDMNNLEDLEWKAIASSKSTGRYMPYFNVASFLRTCKILGMAGIDLFTPSDVVEKGNMRKVCMCIRSLSKKARSRNLNVPDFDIVTYTVAMPTDMVECIRRSLELVQYSSSVSVSHDMDSSSKMVSWQRKHGAAFGNSDCSSDGSDNTESSCLESHRASPNYPEITASLSTPDSPELICYSSVQVGLKLDIGEEERDGINGQCMSTSIAESVGSACSQIDCDHELDSEPSSPCLGSHFVGKVSQRKKNSTKVCEIAVQNHIPFYLEWEDNSLAVEDSGHADTPQTDYISHGVEDSDMTLIVTDCCCSHTLTAASHIFNAQNKIGSDLLPISTHPASKIRHKRSSNIEIDGVDCINSTEAGRAMSLDLHHLCAKKDEFEDSDGCLSSSRCLKTDDLRWSLENEESHSDTNLDADVSSNKLLQPSLNCLFSPKEGRESLSWDNGICTSHIYKENVNDEVNSTLRCYLNERYAKEYGKEAFLTSIVKSDHSVENSSDDLEAAIREDINCQEQQDIFNEDRIDPYIQFLGKIDRHSLDTVSPDDPQEYPDLAVGCSENSIDKGRQVFSDYEGHHCEETITKDRLRHLKDATDKGLPQHKSHRTLLKSVVGGTALLGVLFFFLHFRRNGRQKVDEAGTQSGHIPDRNAKKPLPQDKKKGVRQSTSGVYPAEKLLFGV
ncbi:hypothetical protein Nepgr_001396 [Nepenthes gracilis]|uniref:Calponin-homology (CH) domain-containing protein n=1 Tax=Nepenthes gracilis TaxID=150966 RepID=A0AAD3P8G4_NEPGR|nr:hypothetical protein Nepgr_001396 [Nepenthes gracilis]